ncbi:MAG: hypothetical protein ABH860_01415 [bacterium]
MKKPLSLILIFVFLAASSWCVNIDGKFWDWAKVKTFYRCKPHALEQNRSGFDMENVKMVLGKKHLYMYIYGRSVTGSKPDAGWGVKKTSVRISFKSSQSPLNRVRIAAYPARPGEIKLSHPPVPSKVFGSKTDKYWAIAKYGKKYAFEIKMPFFASAKGLHIGAIGGPLIKLSPGNSASRKNLSDILINTVDMKTHRLIDTVEFTLRKGDL